MDDAMKMGKTSATGSYHLFVGKLSSSVILAVGTLILNALILDSDYGLYAVALVPSTAFLLFSDLGISSALVVKCAKYRKAKKAQELRQTVISALIFGAASGLLLTGLLLISANFIATSIFSKPESAFLIFLSSIEILATSIFTVIQSVFIGFEKMKPISFTLVLQAFAQSATAPILVYLGYGSFGALIGHITASVTASIISLILFYFLVFRKLEKIRTNFSNIINELKPLLKYGIPLSIGAIISGITVSFYNFMMASFVDDLALIGNYRVATNFMILLTFFSSPLTTVLFPAFSKLSFKKEPKLTRRVFSSSIKYSSLILTPATMLLIVLSDTIISALYGTKWPVASSFLTFSILGRLLVIFGFGCLQTYLNAMGQTKSVMKVSILSLVIGVPLGFVLVPWFGIYGVIACSLVTNVVSVFVLDVLIHNKYGAKADLNNSLRIFLGSLLSMGVTYLFLNSFEFSQWIELGIGFTLFSSVYLIVVPLIGGINKADIENLRTVFSGLGLVSKILEIALRIMEKPLKLRS